MFNSETVTHTTQRVKSVVLLRLQVSDLICCSIIQLVKFDFIGGNLRYLHLHKKPSVPKCGDCGLALSGVSLFADVLVDILLTFVRL